MLSKKLLAAQGSAFLIVFLFRSACRLARSLYWPLFNCVSPFSFSLSLIRPILHCLLSLSLSTHSTPCRAICASTGPVSMATREAALPPIGPLPKRRGCLGSKVVCRVPPHRCSNQLLTPSHNEMSVRRQGVNKAWSDWQLGPLWVRDRRGRPVRGGWRMLEMRDSDLGLGARLCCVRGDLMSP